jgi:hypothetical protein
MLLSARQRQNGHYASDVALSWGLRSGRARFEMGALSVVVDEAVGVLADTGLPRAS